MKKLREDAASYQKNSRGQKFQYLHHIADCISGRKSKNYQDFEDALSLEEWWTLNDFYDHLFRESVISSYSQEKELGSLSAEFKQLVLIALNVRRDDIIKSLKNSASHISQRVLKDFDWEMKLIMSSDKMATLHEPVLNLELDVGADQHEQHLAIEMNRDELTKFISQLEGANRSLQQLKA